MPNEPTFPPVENAFSGLTPWGWIKLVFKTRARTIKQCDNVTHEMFVKMMQACASAEANKNLVGRLAFLVTTQAEALQKARISMIDAGWATTKDGHFNETFEKVCGAIEAHGETL